MSAGQHWSLNMIQLMLLRVEIAAETGAEDNNSRVVVYCQLVVLHNQCRSAVQHLDHQYHKEYLAALPEESVVHRRDSVASEVLLFPLFLR